MTGNQEKLCLFSHIEIVVVLLALWMMFSLQKDYLLSRGKYGNTELIKIPNFLHLTPPHIKKHCQAIKSK